MVGRPRPHSPRRPRAPRGRQRPAIGVPCRPGSPPERRPMDAALGRLLFFLLPLILPLLRLVRVSRRQGRARGDRRDAARPAHPQRRHRHQRGRARLLIGSSPLRQAEDGARPRHREDGARARRREGGARAERRGGLEVGARRVGADLASSISLPASLFTRSVMLHPTTNSLVTLLARLIVMSITERAQRYLSDTRSDKS